MNAIGRFKSRLFKAFNQILALILLIFAVTIVYLFSVGTDLLVLYFINIFFGTALSEIAKAKIFFNLTNFDLFKLISSSITVGGYILTLGFLIFRYIKDFLQISWDPGADEPENLRAELVRSVEDTGTSLVVIGTIALICLILIGAIALVLWVVDFAVSMNFVNILKLLATVAISIVYIYTIGYSLYKYARDLLRMSFGSST